MVKNSYKDDNVDELKELVKTELLERGYATDIITEYMEYVDILYFVFCIENCFFINC